MKCQKCDNLMFLANTEGTDIECKHCRYIGSRDQLPACSGYLEDLLQYPRNARYLNQLKSLSSLIKSNEYYQYDKDIPDKEIKGLTWDAFANINTGEIFVQAKFKDKIWADSFFTKVFGPHIKDRIFGTDIQDRGDINNLSNVMFENIKEELT